MQPTRVMADPARVKSEAGSDATFAESAHQDKNAGEGSSGGHAASDLDQTSMKQEDKVVRCDSIHSTSTITSTPTYKINVDMDIYFLTVYSSL